MKKSSSRDITNLLSRQFGDAETQQRPSFTNNIKLTNQRKGNKALKVLGTVVASVAVIAATTLLVLKSSQIPYQSDTLLAQADGTTNNPYTTSSYELNSHGFQSISLKRDQNAVLEQGNLEVGGNVFANNVGIDAQLINYQTARFKFYNSDNYKGNYEVPSQFQGDNYDKDFHSGINFNHLGFKFSPQGRFEMSIFDRDDNDREYISTVGEPFVAMSNYMEIGFKIEATRLFGLGERTRDFRLQEGTYTMFPQNNPGVIDDGQIKAYPKQQSGMHPFLMAQIRNESRGFFGIYLRNSNAQQVSIKFAKEDVVVDGQTVTKTFAHLDFKANGGMLDLYFFLGPSYQDVLQQYHNVIGIPALPPHFSQGLFLSNDGMYNTQDNMIILVEILKQSGFPFDGIVVSPDLVRDQHQFALKEGSIDLWHQIFPEVKWIFPFSPIVDKANAAAFQKKWPGLLVSVDGNLVEVTAGTTKGYCFDYFHPDTHKVLESMTKTFHPEYTGLWLYYTQPYASSTNFTSYPNDPYKNIPFLNDQNGIFKSTLPLFAEHAIGPNGKMEKHYNLHGVHGSQMAYQWQEFLRDPLKNTIGSFVLADSTFAGAGSRAIAHVYPKLPLSSQSLEYAASQILNFNMFGMPITGHNVCGYQRDDTQAETRELCVRSYQLALVTPLAMYNSDSKNLAPYPDDKEIATQVASNLKARLSLLTYQRTELYKISKMGGALNRPVFAEFPDSTFFSPDDVDTMMYGDAIKVDFVFQSGVTTKTVNLPENSYWFNLFDFTLVYPRQGDHSVELPAPLSTPIALQKAGTIVPTQDPLKDGRRGTDGLTQIPLTISALLDQDKTATGHVLVEDLQGNSEFYEMRVQSNMMLFKQQNEGQVDSNSGMKQIRRINIASKAQSFASQYQACAIWNDHQSVQTLNAVVDTEADQITISPLQGETMNIDKILFVVWGKPTVLNCNASLLQSKVILNITDPTTVQYRQQFVIRQNIQGMIGDIPDMTATVYVQDDNSVRLEWFPHGSAGSQSSEEGDAFRRSAKVGLGKFLIKDVITISYDPFYLEIHDPTDKSRVFFTTKSASSLFTNDFSMLTYFNPLSDPSRYFGIGERKGSFWLQDNYQYSLFTNNHNLRDIVQANGKTVQFCKNGFFPIIYNQIASSKDGLMAVWLTEGSKDIFFTKAYKVGGKTMPKVSFVQTVNHVDMTILFDQQPEQLFKDAFKAEYKAGVQIPPTYALGQYHLVRNLVSTNDFIKIYNNYNQEYKWPLEGFVLDLNFTGYQSMSFNQDYIAGNIDVLVQYLNVTNQTLIQIMKAGIPKRSDAGKKLISSGAAITRQPYYIQQAPALTGLDQSGEVIFANYFKKNAALTNYVDGIFTNYEKQYKIPRYGVDLMHNEIYDVYCTQDCINDNQYDPQPKQFYKVGIDQMLRNSLTASSIKNSDQHNGYGYKQQSYLQQQDSQQKKFYISSSNTASSGRFGNVGRLIDYIYLDDDATTASVALQSLSLLGMGLIGEKFGAVNNEIARQTRQQHIVIQTFSPLAAHQWHELNNKDDDIKAGGLVRYKYMLVKYTQTQLYRQAAFGNPLIRPVWVSFSDDQQTYTDDVINNQYMYGDSFMVPIDYAQKPYYPAGTWCTLMYFNPLKEDPQCFTNPTGTNVYIGSKFFYQREGTITPLQDPEGHLHDTRTVRNTHDLLDTPVDLHINPRVFTDSEGSSLFTSTGQILYYSDDSSTDLHCFVEIIHRNDTIYFQMVEGRDISVCSNYPGFKIGTIVIYNVDQRPFPFTKVTINGNTDDVILAKQGGPNKKYIFFDLTLNKSGVKNLQGVEQIKFWY